MKFTKTVKMIHPGKKLIEEIRNRNWTQKQFAVFVGKKNSEVNELIKGKRNITIQWDLILSEVFGTPEKYWINMQTDYDYEIAKKQRELEKKQNQQDFEIVSNIGEQKEDHQDSKDDNQENGEITQNNMLPNNINESETKEESEVKEPDNKPENHTDTTQENMIEELEKKAEEERKLHRYNMKKIFMNF